MTDAAMLAVIPVRSGLLPMGADETVAEANGTALLVGSGCDIAAKDLTGIASTLWAVELDVFSPGRWALAVAAAMAEIGAFSRGHVLLPGSPDGRDLGPRLAVALDRDFVAAAIQIGPDTAEVSRFGGRVTNTLALAAAVVATLQPGVRGVQRRAEDDHTALIPTRLSVPEPALESAPLDPTLLEELPADPSTMDLAEANRIVGGGAGLGSREAFDDLAKLAARLGASPGGTRVVTDWGWLPVERQIGTTGVAVNPSLYLALGISGAVQHTAGLGSPDHIISVNSDPHCPMMGMADLAIVSDGPEFLRQLLARLQD